MEIATYNNITNIQNSNSPSRKITLDTRNALLYEIKFTSNMNTFQLSHENLQYDQQYQEEFIENIAKARLRRMHEYLCIPKNGKELYIFHVKREYINNGNAKTMEKNDLMFIQQWNELEQEDQLSWNDKYKQIMQEILPSQVNTKPNGNTGRRKKSQKNPQSTTTNKTKKRKSIGQKTDASPSPPKKTKVSLTARNSLKSKLPKPISKGSRQSKGKKSKSSMSTNGNNKSVESEQTNLNSNRSLKVTLSLKRNNKSNGMKELKTAGTGSEESGHDEDEDPEVDEDSPSAGSASEDDSDDNMAQLPTGAFG